MGTVYLTGERHPLQLWPEEIGPGDCLRIAFVAPSFAGGKTWKVVIRDDRRRIVATLLDGPARTTAGVILVVWDGRDKHGRSPAAAVYRVEVTLSGSRFRLERTFVVTGWVSTTGGSQEIAPQPR